MAVLVTLRGNSGALTVDLAAGPTVAVVQSVANGNLNSYASSGSVTITGVAAGNALVLLLYVAHDFTGAANAYPASISAPNGSTWVLADRNTGNAYTDYDTAVLAYTAKNVDAGSHTVNLVFQGSSEYRAVIYELTPFGAVEAVGVFGTESGTTDFNTTTAGNLSADAAIALGMIGQVEGGGADPNIVIGSGFTAAHFARSTYHSYVSASKVGDLTAGAPLTLPATPSGTNLQGGLGVVLVLTAEGPSGALTGTTALSFAASASSLATGALSGAATVALTPAAALAATGACSGAAALALAATATISELGAPTAFDPYYDPGFALNAGTGAVPRPARTKPASKASTYATASYVDASFDTRIYRATDVADGDAGQTYLRHEYSRKKSFNSDGTLFFAQATNGFWYLYDALTFAKLDGGRTSSPGNTAIGPATTGHLAGDCEATWHPTDPEKIWYTDNNGSLIWYEFNLATKTRSTLFDLTSKLAAISMAAATRAWWQGEGRPSDDGRYWGLSMQDGAFDQVGLLMYDRVDDAVLGSILTTNKPNNVSTSPSGLYCIPSWSNDTAATFAAAAAAGINSTDGTRAYNRTFSAFQQMSYYGEHADTGKDAYGNDVYISINYNGAKMPDVADGQVYYRRCDNGVAYDLGINVYGGASSPAVHISGGHPSKPGWAVVGTYGAAGGGAGATKYDEMLTLVEIAPTGSRTFRLAHHQSRVSDYWDEPHATANHDLTKILFASDFNGTNRESYMIGLPSWAVPTSGASGGLGGTSSVSLSATATLSSIAPPGAIEGTAALSITTTGTATDAAVIVDDTFTEAGDPLLASHTPEIGGAWTKLSGLTLSIVSSVGAVRAPQYDGGKSLYQNEATPSTADYSVEGELVSTAGAQGGTMVAARINGAQFDRYEAGYINAGGNNNSIISKWVGGVQTVLYQSAGNDYINANGALVKLVVEGSDISMYSDGVLVQTVVDASITAVGKGGISPSSNNSGFATDAHLSSFKLSVLASSLSALSGSATLSLATSGTVSGGLSLLVGSSTLALATAGTLGATGSRPGTTSLALATAGTLSGLAPRTGSAAIAFSATAALAATGALSGTAAISFVPAATAASGADLTGASALSFAPSATLQGAAALAGSTALALTATAAVAGGLSPMVGGATLALAAAGTVAGTGRQPGVATISLLPTATLRGATPAIGTTAVSLAAVATLRGTASLAGSTSVAFFTEGTGLVTYPGLGGVLSISTEATGTLSGAGQMVGAASLSLSGSATGRRQINIAGTTSLTFSTAAASTAITPISGAAAISLASSATPRATGALTGGSAITFDPSATGNLIGVLNGAALISVAIVAELLGRAALDGSASLLLTIRATPAGYTPPVDAEFIIVWADDPPDKVVWASDAIEAIVLENAQSVVSVVASETDTVVWTDAP